MAFEKVNMINNSAVFTGSTTQDFLRSLDAPQALARYILDQASGQSFFEQLPWVIMKTESANDRVWDIVYIDEHYNIVWSGPWLPWPYQQSRQLAWNEAQMGAGRRRDKMTAWLNRFAVATENFMESKLLPNDVQAYVKTMLTNWATEIKDTNFAMTVFRDYPYYYAETDWLTSNQINDRVESMFGRWFNDVDAATTVIMPNGVTDIENLADTDTLNDVFVRSLQQYADQELWVKSLTMKDDRPFFGLIVWDPDIQNFYENASTQFISTMNESFQQTKFDHPLFKLVLDEFANIRFFKYGWLAENDWRNVYADFTSVYKNIMGNYFYPMARVFAAAKWTETIPDMSTRARGAYDLANPSLRNGLDWNGNSYNLYLSLGAKHLPYFAWANYVGSTVVGKDSYNKFMLTSTECANAYCGLNAGEFVWRLQIWEWDAAGSKYKIHYTGPVYCGTIQMAANKTRFGQAQDLFRLRVTALYTWDGAARQLVSNANMSTEFDTLRTFLGIDPVSHKATIGWIYGWLEYQKRRKAHIFNTVRSILFWEALVRYLDLLWSSNLQSETRDYGAVSWFGITIWDWRKLVVSADGSLRSYAVVIFKRPPLV